MEGPCLFGEVYRSQNTGYHGRCAEEGVPGGWYATTTFHGTNACLPPAELCGLWQPLLLSEFNLILKAAQKPETSECFLMLFFGTVVMLAGGYAGEPDPLEAWIGVLQVHARVLGADA